MGSVRHYQQQYGDMYFLRLARLKATVEKVATDAWGELRVRMPCWRRELYNSTSRTHLTMLLLRLDCWRICATRGPSARCATGRALLDGWHSIHGHAIEAQHFGGSDKRGMYYCMTIDQDPSDTGTRLSRLPLLPAVPMPTRPTRPRLRS
jgi:hypothetical protein